MNNSQWVRFIWTNTFEKQDTILHFPGLFVALTLLCWFPAFVSLSSCRDCYLVLPLLTLSFGTDHVPTGEKSNSNGSISSTVFFFGNRKRTTGMCMTKNRNTTIKIPVQVEKESPLNGGKVLQTRIRRTWPGPKTKTGTPKQISKRSTRKLILRDFRRPNWIIMWKIAFATFCGSGSRLPVRSVLILHCSVVFMVQGAP